MQVPTPQSLLLHLVILCIGATGCIFFERSAHQDIAGGYTVGWSDLESNRSITRSNSDCDGCVIVLVTSYVFAVGNNDSFIISKSHNGGDLRPTLYHIIDIAKNEKGNYREAVYGPLTKEHFERLRTRLRISHVPFHLTYPKNPPR